MADSEVTRVCITNLCGVLRAMNKTDKELELALEELAYPFHRWRGGIGIKTGLGKIVSKLAYVDPAEIDDLDAFIIRIAKEAETWYMDHASGYSFVDSILYENRRQRERLKKGEKPDGN